MASNVVMDRREMNLVILNFGLTYNTSVPMFRLFRSLPPQELYLSSQPEQIQSLTRCPQSCFTAAIVLLSGGNARVPHRILYRY